MWKSLFVPRRQRIRAGLLPHPWQHPSSFVLQMTMSMLMGVGWNSKISLICISLIDTDVRHSFM